MATAGAQESTTRIFVNKEGLIYSSTEGQDPADIEYPSVDKFFAEAVSGDPRPKDEVEREALVARMADPVEIAKYNIRSGGRTPPLQGSATYPNEAEKADPLPPPGSLQYLYMEQNFKDFEEFTEGKRTRSGEEILDWKERENQLRVEMKEKQTLEGDSSDEDRRPPSPRTPVGAAATPRVETPNPNAQDGDADAVRRRQLADQALAQARTRQ